MDARRHRLARMDVQAVSVRVSSWAWDQTLGDPEAKLLLLKLADQANDDGVCWPSQRTLERSTELSVRTIQRRQGYLVERGLLVVIERPGRSNLYQLQHGEQGTSASRTPGEPTSDRRTTYVSSDVPGTSAVADRTVIETSRNLAGGGDTSPHRCPLCKLDRKGPAALADHLRNVHGVEDTVAA